MPLTFISEDITKVAADAIVNAANPQLRAGGGVCGAIFRAAGYEKLQSACDRIGGCHTGQAVITEGFALPAKYVIYTVGPRYRPGTQGQAGLLRDCYENSLALARWYGLCSIVFPLISSGKYGYPRWEALDIAIHAIVNYLEYSGDELDVSLCLLDPDLLSAAESIKAKWLEKTLEDKVRKAQNYDAEMSGMRFKQRKIAFYPEDLAKMETMTVEEQTDFVIQLRKAHRYVYVEADDAPEDK